MSSADPTHSFVSSELGARSHLVSEFTIVPFIVKLSSAWKIRFSSPIWDAGKGSSENMVRGRNDLFDILLEAGGQSGKQRSLAAEQNAGI
ncbi:unnamed protein product [Linum trigynum]|uniref:Uncharacterized protein n=1 Tax=Linum trigynum TaxID=586398 RepID=A0AAV2CX09_9ROSI